MSHQAAYMHFLDFDPSKELKKKTIQLLDHGYVIVHGGKVQLTIIGNKAILISAALLVIQKMSKKHHTQTILLFALSNNMLRFAHCVAPKTRLLIGSIQQPIRIHQMICFEVQRREQY